MNYLVPRHYDSRYILDFIIIDEVTDRYKSHLFSRDGSYKEDDWRPKWSSTYRSIMSSSMWTRTPTTISTPEKVVSNHPELFI